MIKHDVSCEQKNVFANNALQYKRNIEKKGDPKLSLVAHRNCRAWSIISTERKHVLSHF